MRPLPLSFLAAVVAAGLVTVANAANPASGTISNASPSVKWDGEVTNSYAARIPVVVTGDDSVPCSPPGCDAFALKLADAGDLTVSGTAPGGTSTGGDDAPAQATIRVRMPDGSVVIFTGDATEDKPLTGKIKKAPAGDYDVEYWNNFINGPVAYVGTAMLGSAPAPVAPAPGATPAPTPAPGSPAPAAKQGLKISAKVGKTSARKRKVIAKVKVSRQVKSLSAKLMKGRKTIGRAKAKNVKKSKTLKIKARKLRKGTYKLVLTADDGNGVKAAKTIKVKVRK